MHHTGPAVGPKKCVLKLNGSVHRIRRGKRPGKRGGPACRVRPRRQQDPGPADGPGRDQPVRAAVASSSTFLSSHGSDVLHTRPWAESPLPPPLPSASPAAGGAGQVKELQEDKNLFVLS